MVRFILNQTDSQCLYYLLSDPFKVNQEEEEEIEINSSRKIGTCTAENPLGLVDTVTRAGELGLVTASVSREPMI